jgi:hypothetical protein
MVEEVASLEIYYLMAPTRATTQKKVKEILASRAN